MPNNYNNGATSGVGDFANGGLASVGQNQLSGGGTSGGGTTMENSQGQAVQGSFTNNSGPIGQTTGSGPYDQADPTGMADPFGFNANGAGSGFGAANDIPYASAINSAGTQAGAYDQMAQQSAGNTQAAQINNPYAQQSQQNLSGVYGGQNALLGQLQSQAQNGRNSSAYQQYQNTVGQNATAQNALANSTTGGAGNASAARRDALQGNVMNAAGSAAGGQLVADQAQQAAQGQISGILGQQGSLANAFYGQNYSLANAQAQLQQQQQGIANAGQLGYGNLAQQEQGAQLNALQGMSQNELASQGENIYSQGVDYNNTMAYAGMGLSAGSGLASAGAQIAGNNNEGPGT